MPRVTLWTIPAALLIALGASAPAAAGGGGQGGACYQDAPSLGEGWVAVLDSCFAPQTISIASGEAVRWDMRGDTAHTVTLDAGPDSGPLQSTEFALRFNEPGTYGYSCRFHPGMTGSVVVTGGSLGGTAIERLDDNGSVVERFAVAPAVGAPSEPRPDVATTPAAQRHRIEVDPVTALVVLLVLFPVSMGAAMRLVASPGRGLPSPLRRVRWRLPVYVEQARKSVRRPGGEPRRSDRR